MELLLHLNDDELSAVAAFVFKPSTVALGLSPVAVDQFLAAIRRQYHSVPYHCWRHVVTVLAAAWSFVRRNAVPLSEFQILALFTATICHDVVRWESMLFFQLTELRCFNWFIPYL